MDKIRRSMAPPSGTKRERYGTRQLIEKVFLDPANAIGLKTSELVLKVQSTSGAGSKIPGPTIFQAARALVKKKVLEAKREGREFRFKLAEKQDTGAAPSSSEFSASSSPSPSEIPGPSAISTTHPDVILPREGLPGTSSPHRLDPGQILVLKHDEREVVTLTNVHGKVLIERHAL